MVLVTVADAVDARYGGHDHHIAPLDQALRCTQAHLLDVIVDRAVLFDEQVARRHVGFRLIVVVVGNEVLDGILRKEFLELRVQLRRQRLVRRQHQRRPPGASDDVGHGVGFTRAGHTQQGLKGQAILDALDQLSDRHWLIAGRRKRLVQPVRTARKSHHRRALGRFAHVSILRFLSRRSGQQKRRLPAALTAVAHFLSIIPRSQSCPLRSLPRWNSPRATRFWV